MLRKYLPPLILSILLSLPAAAQQATDRIKKAVEDKWGVNVISVTKTPYLGLYEVYTGSRIIYTDEKTSVFVVGNLIDDATRMDVTEARLGELSRIKFSDLPFKQAIKQVRGNGKRVLVTFEDPNCGYCKVLNKELVKLNDVTIYTFLFPILGDNSMDKSKRIWCAKDRAKAWNDWMIHNKTPSGSDQCDTQAITRNQEYARGIGLSSTPTLFFADGIRIPGALPLAEIEKKMNSLTK